MESFMTFANFVTTLTDFTDDLWLLRFYGFGVAGAVVGLLIIGVLHYFWLQKSRPAAMSIPTGEGYREAA